MGKVISGINFPEEIAKKQEKEICKEEGFVCIEVDGLLYKIDEEGCVDCFINGEWVDWALSYTGPMPTEVQFIVNGRDCSNNEG